MQKGTKRRRIGVPLEQPVPSADESDGSPLSPMEKDVRRIVHCFRFCLFCYKQCCGFRDNIFLQEMIFLILRIRQIFQATIVIEHEACCHS